MQKVILALLVAGKSCFEGNATNTATLQETNGHAAKEICHVVNEARGNMMEGQWSKVVAQQHQHNCYGFPVKEVLFPINGNPGL